jgi:hypothetical protein
MAVQDSCRSGVSRERGVGRLCEFFSRLTPLLRVGIAMPSVWERREPRIRTPRHRSGLFATSMKAHAGRYQ